MFFNSTTCSYGLELGKDSRDALCHGSYCTDPAIRQGRYKKTEKEKNVYEKLALQIALVFPFQ